MKRKLLYDMWWTLVWFIIFDIRCCSCNKNETLGICSMLSCDCSIINQQLNIKCIFADDQEIELYKNSIPAHARKVSISHCHFIKIHTSAFTDRAQHKRDQLTIINNSSDYKQADRNDSFLNLLFEVSECNRLILESNAFDNVQGLLSISIHRCQFVEIQPNAFSSLLQLEVSEVTTLDLSSNAFKFDVTSHGHQGPTTKILFQRVKIAMIPCFAFPSSAAEISMDDVWVGVIHRDAFCAVMILILKLSNTSILEITSGAFSEQTLIRTFEVVNVQLGIMKMGAFKAAATNFSIQYSRFEKIETSAIEVSAATIGFYNNEFRSLQKSSMIFKEWNHIFFGYNLFVDLGEDAIVADEVARMTLEDSGVEFTFIGNRIYKAVQYSLRFTIVSEKARIAKVEENYFEQTCDCSMIDWMEKVIGKSSLVTQMMKSSLCVTEKWLEECFKIPKDFFSMQVYTDLICISGRGISCQERTTYLAKNGTGDNSNIHLPQNDSVHVGTDVFTQLEYRNIILLLTCIVVAVTLIATIFIISFLCKKYREKLLKLNSFDQDVTRFQPYTTTDNEKLNTVRSLLNHNSNHCSRFNCQTNIFESSLQRTTDDRDEHFTYTEDKATQTLPEELTEEYLKNLKNQLNDPENYTHARDVIEHLYDLITVEENCNNNNDRGRLLEKENMYDIIAPRVQRSKTLKTMVNIGTKIPSLEKLMVSHKEFGISMNDYAQPHDQQSSNQDQLYTELPSIRTASSTSVLRPVEGTFTSQTLENHQFQSDVIYDHSVLKSFLDEWTRGIYPSTLFDRASTKSSGYHQDSNSCSDEKGNAISQRTSLYEYRDHSSVATHIYSEIPESRMISRLVQEKASKPLLNKLN